MSGGDGAAAFSIVAQLKAELPRLDHDAVRLRLFGNRQQLLQVFRKILAGLFIGRELRAKLWRLQFADHGHVFRR